MSGDIIKKYNQLANEVPQKEPITFDLDHIPLPNLHPDPKVSIELTQHVVDIVDANDSLNYFHDIFKELDMEDSFFFSKYLIEYLHELHYKTFIKKHVKQKYELPATLVWDFETSFSEFKNKMFIDPVKNYRLKLDQLYQIYEFVALRHPFLTIEMKRLYQNKQENIDSKYLDDFSIFSARNLNHNLFRVDISKNSEEYIFKVRELFPTKFDNLAIDSFISNSFSYPDNNTKIELLSLSFGNRNETNIVFHDLYSLHKEIVKAPKVVKLDFARLMFLNIKSIRDNFIQNSSESANNEMLDSY